MKKIDIGTLERLVSEGEVKRVKRIMSNLDHGLIVLLLDQARDDYKAKIFSLLEKEVASDVILDLSEYSRDVILSHLTKVQIGDIVTEMESDETADLVINLPRKSLNYVLRKLTKPDREGIQQLMKYEEDTAGGLMQLETVMIRTTMTVKEAIKQISRQSEKVEHLHNVFVVDKQGRLKGVLPLRMLILAGKNDKVESLMDRDVKSVSVGMDVEEVARIFKQEDLSSMPVIDSQERVLGRITFDDVLDVIEEEAEEDLYRLSGISTDERVFDPLKKSIRGRLPWLIVNIFTLMLAAVAVSFFEGTIQEVVALAVFLPVVAGLGGNAGTQSLTIITRGIALGHLERGGVRRILLKEVSLGLLNGFIIGLIVGAIAYVWKGSQMAMLGAVIFIAMCITLAFACFLGTLVPFALKKFGVDPAVASSVLVTAFTDVIGFVTFLGVATILLGLA